MPKDTARSTKREVTAEMPLRDQSGRNALTVLTTSITTDLLARIARGETAAMIQAQVLTRVSLRG